MTTWNVGQRGINPVKASSQDDLYREAAAEYGAALDRLARAYEADAEKRRDLLQEIHFALWRSLETFDARCSLRTWIYRVGHNVAASYVGRQRRSHAVALVSLEEVETLADPGGSQPDTDRQHALNRLLALIRKLKPLDRQVILSYLEGLDATAIGEITGISPGNAATKIHRIKGILARQFHQGGHHAE
jgi:RNA polymerase sigma-70 factor (ECF subfamily)